MKAPVRTRPRRFSTRVEPLFLLADWRAQGHFKPGRPSRDASLEPFKVSTQSGPHRVSRIPAAQMDLRRSFRRVMKGCVVRMEADYLQFGHVLT